MDLTSTGHADEPLAVSPKRSRLKTLMFACLGLVGILFALVALVPSILSMGVIRNSVMSIVNQAIAPAKVSIEDWDFAWFGKQTVSGISYQSLDQGIDASVKQVELSSLWQLLPLGKLSAVCHVEQPIVAVTLPEQATSTPPSAQAGIPPRVQAAPPTLDQANATSETQTAPTEVWLPKDLALNIQITNGQLKFGAKQAQLVRDLTIAIKTDHLDDPLVFDLALLLPGQGTNGLTIGAKAAPIRQLANQHFETLGNYSVDLQMDSLEAIKQVMCELTGMESMPLPDGSISLKANLAAQSPNQVDLSLTSLTPWTQIKLNAQGDSAQASGASTFSMHVAIAQFLSDFKQFLPTELTAVQDGKLTIQGQANLTAEQSDIRLAAATDRLTIQTPTTLRKLAPEFILSATLNHEDWTQSVVKSLLLKFPGVDLQAKGSIHDIQGALHADIPQVLAVCRDFVKDLPEIKGVADLRMRSKDNKLSLDGTFLAPQERHTLTASTTLSEDFKHLIDIQCTLLLNDALTCSLTAPQITPSPLKINNLQVKTQAHFKPLIALAKHYAPQADLAALQSLEGTLFFNASAAGTRDKITSLFNASMQQVAFDSSTWAIAEPEILKLGGEVAFTGADARITLSNFDLITPPATITIPYLSIDLNTPAPLATLQSKITGVILPNYFVDTWRKVPADTPKQTIDGVINLDCTTEVDQHFLPKTQVHLFAKAIKVNATSPDAISAPFDLAISLSSPEPQAIALEQFALKSPYLRTHATGQLTDLAQTAHLKLAGDLTVDFNQLSTLPQLIKLKDLAVIKGCNTHPFTLDAPLAGGAANLLSTLTANAAVSFDSIESPAIDIGKGEFAVSVSQGVAALRNRIPINQGAINLNADVLLTQVPMVVQIPEDTALLDQVNITQKMADFGLGYINPLLTQTLAPHGALSLLCKQAAIPLTDNALELLLAKMTLTTQDVSLGVTGTLKQLLTACKRDDAQIDVDAKAIDITIQDGLLHSKDFTIKVKGHPINCTGTTRLLTKQVDFVANVPIALFYKKAKNHDRTIPVTISGTVDNPHLNQSELISEVANVVKDELKTKATDKIKEALHKKGFSKKLNRFFN